MKKWFINYKTKINHPNYLVLGARLFDTSYYGGDGMADYASPYPMDKWELTCYSWERVGDGVTAGNISRVKVRKEFHSKDEANAMWSKIRDGNLSFKDLQSIGFEEVA